MDFINCFMTTPDVMRSSSVSLTNGIEFPIMRTESLPEYYWMAKERNRVRRTQKKYGESKSAMWFLLCETHG